MRGGMDDFLNRMQASANDESASIGLAIAQNIADVATALSSFLGVSGTGGTATWTAAASIVVSSSAVTATSLVFISPASASAATLSAGASAPYVSALTAGASFTLATADAGNAAGGEIYNWLLVNLT